MRFLIVEDEPLAARRLRRLLAEHMPEATVVAQLDSVASTLAWLDRDQPVDLVLLDIELLDGSAFEIFEQRPIDLPVIFCTAYDEHAIRAFKVNSVDYLLKPITPEALAAALDKWRRLHADDRADDAGGRRQWSAVADLAQGRAMSRKSSFVVQKGSRLHPVSIDEIAFFWTSQKIVRLVTRDGERFLLDLTLDDLDRMLDPEAFFRISRQVVLSYSAITSVRIDTGRLYVEVLPSALPRQDVSLLVSRDRSSAFRAWLDR